MNVYCIVENNNTNPVFKSCAIILFSVFYFDDSRKADFFFFFTCNYDVLSIVSCWQEYSRKPFIAIFSLWNIENFICSRMAAFSFILHGRVLTAFLLLLKVQRNKWFSANKWWERLVYVIWNLLIGSCRLGNFWGHSWRLCFHQKPRKAWGGGEYCHERGRMSTSEFSYTCYYTSPQWRKYLKKMVNCT